MNNHLKTGLLLCLGLAMAGCGGQKIKPGDILCPIVGAGAGAGIIAAGANTDNTGAIAGGAALGAAVGYLICHETEKPAPTPAPVAAQVPKKAAPPPPPPPPPAPAVGSKLISLEGTNFDFNKATLTATGTAKLDEAVKVLGENPTVKVSVEGHTDSVGSDKYNQGLSERRAKAVVAYLVSKGVDGARLSPVGYGESKPAATNDTAEGRATNRRVDLMVSAN
jgi:OOP family OmpA-OmpF porin